MQFDANTLLAAMAAAFGGFFLRYIWDSIIKAHNAKYEKATKYDQKELEETVSKIVKKMCIEFKGGLEESINEFRTKANAEFERYSKMYWEAVEHLDHVEAEFKHLRTQDIAFYKYQLINACKRYLSQGYITQYQFDRLTELHKIYNDLGGNAQGDFYFNKAIQLPIIKENSYQKIDEAEDDLFVTAADMTDPHIKHVKKEEEQ